MPALWLPGEPNNGHHQEGHVALTFEKGQWGINDLNQYHHLQFICEYDNGWCVFIQLYSTHTNSSSSGLFTALTKGMTDKKLSGP